jgi:hypothetical protein
MNAIEALLHLAAHARGETVDVAVLDAALARADELGTRPVLRTEIDVRLAEAAADSQFPAALLAQLQPGETAIEHEDDRTLPHAVAVSFDRDGALQFRRFYFNHSPVESGGYWYEAGGEEGGPMKLSAAAVVRLRRLLVLAHLAQRRPELLAAVAERLERT